MGRTENSLRPQKEKDDELIVSAVIRGGTPSVETPQEVQDRLHSLISTELYRQKRLRNVLITSGILTGIGALLTLGGILLSDCQPHNSSSSVPPSPPGIGR